MKMYKLIFVFVLYFNIKNTKALQKFVKPQNFRENDSYTKMEEWPCPLTSDIEPCQCYVSDDFKIRIVCDGVVKLDEITRIFSVHFPFNTLEGIFFTVTDVETWESSQPIRIPKNIFQDKTAKNIWIGFKVEEVDPEAFANSAGVLEELAITGQGLGDLFNPLKSFPLYILEDFPNLKYFIIAQTLISDETFQWDEQLPKFEDLVLPNLGNFFSVQQFLSYDKILPPPK